MIHQNIIRHLNRAAVRRGFRAPMTHHVIIGIERCGNAYDRALNRPDTEADGVTGDDTGSVADGFSHHGAGLIRTGMAVISVGAAREEYAGKQ